MTSTSRENGLSVVALASLLALAAAAGPLRVQSAERQDVFADEIYFENRPVCSDIVSEGTKFASSCLSAFEAPFRPGPGFCVRTVVLFEPGYAGEFVQLRAEISPQRSNELRSSPSNAGNTIYDQEVCFYPISPELRSGQAITIEVQAASTQASGGLSGSAQSTLPLQFSSSAPLPSQVAFVGQPIVRYFGDASTRVGYVYVTAFRSGDGFCAQAAIVFIDGYTSSSVRLEVTVSREAGGPRVAEFQSPEPRNFTFVRACYDRFSPRLRSGYGFVTVQFTTPAVRDATTVQASFETRAVLVPV
eukprot:CAMPEP_0198731802 /NCGR_PEP_ID=MMETSP1475-20131203/32213_1 /TAXON_ID= ORGANISM="Unidentified sp., Strain CCMP1999" /NCGR_SAMPLE_ID=MMETSP1475 /ASSEMBLY_ACC=CAM_ASM_001111 /LENGTH=302 /DNA_ID=CAMNT_0044494811 /DNA_START=347 /DNA_END=1255 /DNA_ORIENTATION=-